MNKSLLFRAILSIVASFILVSTIFAQETKYLGEKLSLDQNWRFQLGDASSSENEYFLYDNNYNPFAKSGRMVGITSLNYRDSSWQQVSLPHDWAIELDFVNDKSLAGHGFKPVGWNFPKTSVGWYRKKFLIPEEDKNKRLTIRFDGVYRNCDVWLNGFYMGNNLGGYMEFMYDVTDMVNYGQTNVLVVRVDATQNEGWWYEGAGIYRHVWLIKKSSVYIPEHGTFINTEVYDNYAWVNIQTSLINKDSETKKCQLELQIVNDQGKIIGKANELVTIEEDAEKTVNSRVKVINPNLWSIEWPNLYKLVSTVKTDNIIKDQPETIFGIRSVTFDAQKGLFLNGKPVKIKGVCVHQDHAGVGVAVPDGLQYYRIEKLKEMGCNAYRTAHNPPATELLDACDRLGIMVMDETRLLNGSPEYLSQFERLLFRDRNHPSVIIWSIGNEEMNIQNKESGKRIAETFKKLQRKIDPYRLCTYGGNNGNQFKGVNEVVDVRGINYMNISDIDKYHKDHPDQPLWGSEEASTLCTRGQYSVDKEQGYMSDYDKKENAVFGWCSNAEKWWKFYDEREWLAGGFIWTGFDYRGEPSPYRWPCVNSHFGVMDVCGFPKNNYFYYKAWWTDEDVLHIYPHWNWPGKIGDTVNVWCQTNCQQVELFLNGKSLGTRQVAKNSHIEWDVVYEPGVLEARGTKNGRTIIQKVETTGPSANIVITPDRSTINADGNDVSVLNITVLDREGREVPDADNFITFKINGNGKIIGVGNGNPSSHEPDKIPVGNYFRKLFNGKCQIIVQSTKEEGEIKLYALSDGMETAETLIKAISPGEKIVEK